MACAGLAGPPHLVSHSQHVQQQQRSLQGATASAIVQPVPAQAEGDPPSRHPNVACKLQGHGLG